MSNYSRYKKDNKVSALNSALKLITGIFNQIKRWLGIVLIDKAMRYIVNWYDKRHPNSLSNSEKYSQENDSQLQSKIATLNKTISDLEKSVSVLKRNEQGLINQNNSLNCQISQLTANVKKLEDDKIKISSRVEELQNDNCKLLSRCLPEIEIPTMIYYAQGDASGLSLRKISSLKTSQHTYKITTFPGDATSAVFEPVVDTNIQDVINNRNITLIACDIVGIAPNASNIVLQEKGKVVYRDNKWEVINKAKIFLS